MKFKNIITGLLVIFSSLLGLEYHSDGKPIYKPIDVTVHAIEDISVDAMDDIIVYPMSGGYQPSIHLNKGWNLIGIQSDMDLETFKEKIGKNNFLEIRDESGEIVTKLEKGKAYWVKISKDVNFNYLQVESTKKTIVLKSGWNLINPIGELKLDEILNQVGKSNLEVIQGFRKTYKKIYKDEDKSFLNDFTKFEENKGYWIKVKREATLEF